ncbi:hypothetical protein [Methylobacterium brachiatum]
MFLRPADAPGAGRPRFRAGPLDDTGQQQAAFNVGTQGGGAMVEYQPEDRVARIIDRARLAAAVPSRACGLATGLWGLVL